MNQLFYNTAGGIVHKILKIGCEKTISEVIVCGKPNIKQNRNSFYFNFSVESSRFTFNNFITVKLKLTFRGKVLPECLSDSEANRDSADAEFPFPLFFSFFLSHLKCLWSKKWLLLIWKVFQSKEEWRFPFGNIFFLCRDIYVFVLCKWGKWWRHRCFH